MTSITAASKRGASGVGVALVLALVLGLVLAFAFVLVFVLAVFLVLAMIAAVSVLCGLPLGSHSCGKSSTPLVQDLCRILHKS